jgi:hypothetical protein
MVFSLDAYSFIDVTTGNLGFWAKESYNSGNGFREDEDRCVAVSGWLLS